MQTITITVENREVMERILWFLKRFEHDGVEIVAQEDWDDLMLLRATRDEKSIPFSEYLTNADID